MGLPPLRHEPPPDGLGPSRNDGATRPGRREPLGKENRSRDADRDRYRRGPARAVLGRMGPSRKACGALGRARGAIRPGGDADTVAGAVGEDPASFGVSASIAPVDPSTIMALTFTTAPACSAGQVAAPRRRYAARFEFQLLPATRGVLDDPGDLPVRDLVLDPDHRVHRHLPQPGPVR